MVTRDAALEAAHPRLAARRPEKGCSWVNRGVPADAIAGVDGDVFDLAARLGDEGQETSRG
jgi:hypothetical protein